MGPPNLARRPSERIAYIINQYPKVSHSFIRREIQALERLGVQIDRISVRGQDDVLVDEGDKAERTATRYLLGGGAALLLGAFFTMLLCCPRRTFQALRLATGMARKADKSLMHHWVYVVEACLASRWIGESGANHRACALRHQLDECRDVCRSVVRPAV